MVDTVDAFFTSTRHTYFNYITLVSKRVAVMITLNCLVFIVFDRLQAMADPLLALG